MKIRRALLSLFVLWYISITALIIAIYIRIRDIKISIVSECKIC